MGKLGFTPKSSHNLFNKALLEAKQKAAVEREAEISKVDLHSLIDDVKRGDANAVSYAVAFVAAESFGLWHNRARAKLCRYFKNHPPNEDESKTMVDAIVKRLLEGRFYEQFKDQLSMAIRFSPERLRQAASIAVDSERDHIRRYGRWVHNVLESTSAPAFVYRKHR